MPGRSMSFISRRAAVAGLAATAWRTAVAAEPQSEAHADPVFSLTGPDAARYGAAENFPIADTTLWHQPGNPLSPKYRVGAFSHYDEIFPARQIKRAAYPWPFKRSPMDISYNHRGQRTSIVDYLSRNPVTGLLVARDDEVLVEHYQYGRTDRDRFTSQSMAKSITGILTGLAIADGAIKSIDDTAETYVPGFKGTEYGKTPIRDLLHMSSGVEFGEEENNGRDLDRLWIDMVRGGWLLKKGTVGSLVQFNHRIAAPGTRFQYASIEPDVLGMVIRQAVGKPLSDYLHDKVWEPIGAEADASWLIDADGNEVAHSGFNAVLRDYARLGRLLAHDGSWQGRQIIPKQWMIDATTLRTSDAYLSPEHADPTFGYGYLMWLLPGLRREFALFGAMGQRICIDPASKLVMVQTAVESTTEIWSLWSSLIRQFGQG